MHMQAHQARAAWQLCTLHQHRQLQRCFAAWAAAPLLRRLQLAQSASHSQLALQRAVLCAWRAECQHQACGAWLLEFASQDMAEAFLLHAQRRRAAACLQAWRWGAAAAAGEQRLAGAALCCYECGLLRRALHAWLGAAVADSARQLKHAVLMEWQEVALEQEAERAKEEAAGQLAGQLLQGRAWRAWVVFWCQ